MTRRYGTQILVSEPHVWDTAAARMRLWGASRRLIPERCSAACVLMRRSPMSGRFNVGPVLMYRQDPN